MIDLHAHVLPAIDDGPATIEGSLEMLRDAVEDGVTAIACTPHVRDDYPTSASAMEEARAFVRAAAADIPIEVLSGGELALDRAASLPDDELRRFGLGGNPDVVLIECPYTGWPLDIGAITFALAERGVSVVLAHPDPGVAVDLPAARRPHAATLAGDQVRGRSVRRRRSAKAAAATITDTIAWPTTRPGVGTPSRSATANGTLPARPASRPCTTVAATPTGTGPAGVARSGADQSSSGR